MRNSLFSLILSLFFVAIALPVQATANAVQKNIELKHNEIETDLKNGENESAYYKSLALHQSKNLVGTFWLGWMYHEGLFVQKDLEKAAQYLFKAAKIDENYIPTGNVEAAYYYAALFALDQKSKYYNMALALKFLVACQEIGHKEATYLLGRTSLRLSLNENAKDPDFLREKAVESLRKASALGKVEANYFLYKLELEEAEKGSISSLTTIGKLTEAVNKKNEFQGFAANDMALLYKNGRYVSRDLKKYISLLKKSANLGYGLGALNLGKAYLAGVLADPDYEAARFYLEFASKYDEKLKRAAEHSLEVLQHQENMEKLARSFQPTLEQIDNFLTAQNFSNLRSSRDSGASKSNAGVLSIDSASSYQNGYPRIVRFTRTGDEIRGSDGSRFRLRNNTLRSSKGSRYTINGNRIRGSNGVTYKIRGNTIRGSDGTRCRTSGRTTRCY